MWWVFRKKKKVSWWSKAPIAAAGIVLLQLGLRRGNVGGFCIITYSVAFLCISRGSGMGSLNHLLCIPHRQRFGYDLMCYGDLMFHRINGKQSAGVAHRQLFILNQFLNLGREL